MQALTGFGAFLEALKMEHLAGLFEKLRFTEEEDVWFIKEMSSESRRMVFDCLVQEGAQYVRDLAYVREALKNM